MSVEFLSLSQYNLALKSADETAKLDSEGNKEQAISKYL